MSDQDIRGEGTRNGEIDKLQQHAAEHLDPNETALAVVLGTYETKILGSDSVRIGILIAIEKRLAFYAKKLGGYDLPFGSCREVPGLICDPFRGGKSVPATSDAARMFTSIATQDRCSFLATPQGRSGHCVLVGTCCLGENKDGPPLAGGKDLPESAAHSHGRSLDVGVYRCIVIRKVVVQDFSDVLFGSS